MPAGFVLTFPKVTAVEQVSALCELLGVLEERLGLGAGALRFEIQIETTQSIVDATGALAIPKFIAAGQGRVSGLHFGTYDYTAACGLSAADQHLAHAACDFARHVMQVSAAGTGVRLSDGSTNVLPVGDRDAVHDALAHPLRAGAAVAEHGFYQGWDLHPAQLVTRYAANYAFYLGNAAADARRLRAYVAKADAGRAGRTRDRASACHVHAAGARLRRADRGRGRASCADCPKWSFGALARRETV